MRYEITRPAARALRSLPKPLRKLASKQFNLLSSDLRHPSLHAKKYDEAGDIWQGRITRGYRFYFRVLGDAYRILSVTKHR